MDAAFDAASLFKVDGLVAVITGGGTGIGLMVAKALALNGAHKVFILGRRLDKLQEAAQASPSGNIVPIQCDVTSKEQLQQAVERVKQEAGFVNLLLANSGVAGPTTAQLKPDATLEEFRDYCWNMDQEDFLNVYRVNDVSVFYTSIAFLELLDAANKREPFDGVHSQILITSSIASLARKTFTCFAYSSSKAGVTHMGRNLGAFLASYSIRVNMLAPGLFPSEMAGGMMNIDKPVPRDFCPAERYGQPSDMAGTALFLASRAGAYLDGQIMVLDGGRLKIAQANTL